MSAERSSAFSSHAVLPLERPKAGKGQHIPGDQEYRRIWDSEARKYVHVYVRSWDTFVAQKEASMRRMVGGEDVQADSIEEVIEQTSKSA